eukprot:CAMPEP_0183429430 /NCGR_PEP_ID=MMETSP0370-20130417/48871_1 /TAXON_ID=268820 /ORGANISM="Peridinium aciculiferum, Strain PAER-2" /LENGTH=70 /DNA_ID=CAMNT_0025614471 /DNA_START=102 /DNA_END=314 /DNA_ORIENTATION=+
MTHTSEPSGSRAHTTSSMLRRVPSSNLTPLGAPNSMPFVLSSYLTMPTLASQEIRWPPSPQLTLKVLSRT